MFVEEEELLDVIVYYKKSGRHYVAYSDKVFDTLGLSDKEKGKFSRLKIKARQLTWGLYNDLQEAAMVKDQFGNRNWNYKVYKEYKLRNIIAKWDATMKDAEGKTIAVPVTHQMISKMSPDIAEVILNVYDQITLIEEEEEKKS